MALFNFKKPEGPVPGRASAEVEAFLQGYSIEVMPRTAAKIDDFRALLPEGTRVYIAHIEGTPIEEMVATAARIKSEGYDVMPHFPARIIKDRATLANWIGAKVLHKMHEGHFRLLFKLVVTGLSLRLIWLAAKEAGVF